MIDTVSGYKPTVPDAPKGGRELDKDAFLQLVTAQVQHQDPMNPASQDQMFSTLSQMGVLEQITNLNKTMADVLQSTQIDLVGRDVMAMDDAGNPIQGVVDEMYFTGGVASMIIGGRSVPAKNILSVARAA